MRHVATWGYYDNSNPDLGWVAINESINSYGLPAEAIVMFLSTANETDGVTRAEEAANQLNSILVKESRISNNDSEITYLSYKIENGKYILTSPSTEIATIEMEDIKHGRTTPAGLARRWVNNIRKRHSEPEVYEDGNYSEGNLEEEGPDNNS
ncbi:hypothetical protein [Alkalibacillus silvisoli]|uniref:Uncharacterized protein n=1 Tax=Alkalibacillus silvisoli TaxID=392823 RepID=A0ABN1A8U9_9BACI